MEEAKGAGEGARVTLEPLPKGRGASTRYARWDLSGGTGGMRMRANVQPVALEVAVQACAADAENLRGAKAVAVTHLKNLLDVVLADFVK